MPIYKGDTHVVGMALGDKQAHKAYHGASLVLGGVEYQDVLGESPAYEQPVPCLCKSTAILNMVGGHSEKIGDAIIHADCESVVSKGNTYALPYEERDGWGIGDIYNERNFKYGKRVQRIGRIVFTGKESIDLPSGVVEGHSAFRYLGVTGKAKHPYMCNDFVYKNYSYTNATSRCLTRYAIDKGQMFFIVPDTEIAHNDITAFKTWLKQRYDSGNPIVVYYKLSSSMETEFTHTPPCISVEECGTVTFDNTPKFEVPNETVYKVPLDTLEAQITALYNSDVKEISNL